MIFDKKALLSLTCSAGVFFRAAAAAEGKSTKGTKGQNNPVPLYFLNPSSCPQKCAQCAQILVLDGVNFAYGQGTPPEVDGHGTGEAVQPCDAENIHQMWRLHQKDGLTMIESYFNPGECLAVVPPQEVHDYPNAMAGTLNDQSGHGGTRLDHGVLTVGAKQFETMKFAFTTRKIGFGDGWVVDDMCHHSSVGLASCNDPAAQWFLNGANLISALCWKNGISSFLTVNEECSELSVVAADGGNDALFRSQTFMLTEQDFIETIVPVSPDEGEQNGSDQKMLGGAELPEPVSGTETFMLTEQDFIKTIDPAPTDEDGPSGVVNSVVVWTVAGAIVEPGDDSEPATPAVCNNPTCDKKQVCAKYSTDADGKCFTQCSNDAITGRRCEIPGETCVHNYDDKSGIMTHWCDCEPDSESSEGEKEVDGKWACLAA
ncbi:hypothetical protein ACHAWC_005491 [Mediolabrus comicus]